VEQHEFSYLPGASFLRFCLEAADNDGPPAAFGYTLEGRLPFAAREAQSVASLVGGSAWIEGQASRSNVYQAAASARILHMATHGEFRADNPLFSGLALADGLLTTLDVFNLRMRCSLVTLSACQTGQSVVSGGDELLGLMRAFLYAGASSLALALWPIEDSTTARLMAGFYRHLNEGLPKGAALRAAQLAVLRHSSHSQNSPAWQHPYYWAAFFLVGHRGPL
jgi:CHAT domain-containing protein